MPAMTSMAGQVEPSCVGSQQSECMLVWHVRIKIYVGMDLKENVNVCRYIHRWKSRQAASQS